MLVCGRDWELRLGLEGRVTVTCGVLGLVCLTAGGGALRLLSEELTRLLEELLGLCTRLGDVLTAGFLGAGFRASAVREELDWLVRGCGVRLGAGG